MRFRLVLGIVVLSWALPAWAGGEGALRHPRELDKAQVQRLKQGQTLTESYGSDGVEGAQGFVLVPLPIEAAYAMMTDYKRFPRWMDDLDAVTMVTWNGTTEAVVGNRLETQFKTIRYALRRYHERPRRVWWHLDSGDLARVEGGYDFYPVAERQTLIRFHTLVDPGFWVPGFVREYFSVQGLETLMANVAAESRRRRAQLVAEE